MSDMPAADLVVRADRVVLPDGERPASVVVSGGVVAAVLPADEPVSAAREVRLAADEVLLPGLVDTHVHVNEPGRTEWEGFASATRAAALGGVTTIIDMPLNSLPPTVSVAALAEKRAAARGQTWVDVGFWGGAVPGNAPALPALLAAGAFGVKCFLADSGVPEFPPLSVPQLRAALAALRPVDGLLVVHAEDPAALGPVADGRSYAGFLASRPPAAETAAIEALLGVAGGSRVHVLHLSAAGAAPMLRAARAAGVRVTAETCPHYLTLAAEDVPDGATEYKCCPPIRSAANRDALWSALAAGDIDCVVSDHSPATPALKQTGDFGTAWGGIASLQLGLPLVWTEARRRGFTLPDVARWMCAAPAALAGLARKAGLGGKGRIAVGGCADFAVFAPDEPLVVDPLALAHRHPVSPYGGRRLTGVVRSTWLRGIPVADAPAGRLLARENG
jgi:allantoinase